MNLENTIMKLEARIKKLEHTAFEARGLSGLFLDQHEPVACDYAEEDLVSIIMRTIRQEQCDRKILEWGWPGRAYNTVAGILNESRESGKNLSISEICEIFADPNPELIESKISVPPQTCYILPLIELILLSVRPNIDNATSKQIQNIKALNKYKDVYYYYALKHLFRDAITTTPELMIWCSEHPHEVNEAILKIFVDGDFVVSEILWPFVEYYHIMRKRIDEKAQSDTVC